MRPKLTVYVHMQDGVAIDAFLTPTSRLFFERIATELALGRVPTEPDTADHEDHLSESPARRDACAVSANPAAEPSYEVIEVPLVFDGEFFDLLQSDVNNLDALQAEEEKKMTTEVVALGKEVSHVSQPSRFSRSDLAHWRCIFELYLDAEVFFATHERDHGARSSQKALKQLQWFQGEVDKRYIAKDFKLRESKLAFARFLNLNLGLLKNLQFQELNKLAVVKILKSWSKPLAVYPGRDGSRLTQIRI